jgi:hypothetical protein
MQALADALARHSPDGFWLDAAARCRCRCRCRMYSRWIGRSRRFRLRQALRAASAPHICCQHDPRRRPSSLEFPTSHPDKSHCAIAATASSRCRCKWTGPKPCDTPRKLPEQLAWDRHFGHLERHVLRVLCQLGSDLHQLLPQCCERPVLHATGQRQPVQEVGKVIGQGEELQTSLVAPERAAGELRPLERVLALLGAEINRTGIAYVPRKSADRLIGPV